jgi:hypothetical protein
MGISLDELLALVRTTSKEEFAAKVAPRFEELDVLQKQMLGELIQRLTAQGITSSLKLGEEYLLKDLQLFSSLNEADTKLLTIAAVYFISHPDEREALLSIDYTEQMLSQSLGVPVRFACNRKVVALFFSYYLSLDMASTHRIPELGRPETQDFIASSFGNSTALPQFWNRPYSVAELSAINAGLYAAMRRNIEQTYEAFGKDLNIEKQVRAAKFRMGGRGVALLVALAIVGYATNFSLPHLFSFKKNSKELAYEAIDHTFDQDVKHITQMSHEELQWLSDEQFEKGKQELIQVLEQAKAQYVSAIKDAKIIPLAPSDDPKAEIKEVFKRNQFTDNVRVVSGSVVDGLSEFKDTLIGLWDEDHARQAKFKSISSGLEKQFRQDVEVALEQLFANPDFNIALEKDMSNGTFVLQAENGLISKYAEKGSMWASDSAKDLAAWGVKKTLGGLLEIIERTFAESWNYLYGKLSGNQEKVSEAKQFFALLAAGAGGAAALFFAFLAIGGPFAVGLYHSAKFTVKWTIKLGIVFFRFEIMGLPKDLMIINGQISLDELGKRSPDVRATLEHVSMYAKAKRWLS